MRSRRGLILAGIGVFLLGLLVTLPARIVYRYAAPPAVSVSGIDGSIWAGHAQEAAVNGLYVRDLHWRIRPLQLLQGKLGYRIEAEAVPGFIESDVSIGVGGAISFAALRAALPLNQLSLVAGPQPLGGHANIDFESLDIVAGIAVAAAGSVEVRNLILPLVSAASLGSYRADFFTQDDGIAASIEDTDGILDLAGSLEIFNDRSYKFLGQVIETRQTPDGVRKQLQFLGPTNARGQRELRLEGSF